MASVRESRGRLFLDYRVGGKRQRTYVKLSDTPANRQLLREAAKKTEAVLAEGGDVSSLLASLGLVEEQSDSNVGGMTTPTAAVEHRAPSCESPAFSAFAEQWFSDFKVGWRETYATTVRGILDRHLLPRFGPLAVRAVSRAQILELRSHLSIARGRRPGSTLSPARINTVLLILRQILREAADRYEFATPRAVKPLKLRKSDVQPFTLEQTQLLIGAIRQDYRDYLTVRFYTGMRSGELHGLKWKYVDFDRRLILVREALVGGKEEYTKNDFSQRDITMSRVVYEALRRQHSATGAMTYVFCNGAGQPVDTANFTKRIWYPLLRHLGLTPRRPYQTRHTAATLWLGAGESPAWVAVSLGHNSQQTLWRVYARFVPNLTRRDGSAMDRLLNAAFDKDKDADGPSQDAQSPGPALSRGVSAAESAILPPKDPGGVQSRASEGNDPEEAS